MYQKSRLRIQGLERDSTTRAALIRNLEASRLNDRRVWQDSTTAATDHRIRKARGQHRRQGAFGLLLLQAAAIVLIKIL